MNIIPQHIMVRFEGIQSSIRKLFIDARYSKNVAEMSRHITAILDGCPAPEDSFKRVKDIMERSGISLLEAGYNRTIGDLALEVPRSIGQYERRIARASQGNVQASV